MAVSQRITQLIKIKKYSNEYVGNQIGSSKTTIGNFKNGKTEPNINLILFLINEFPDLNLKWLFTGKGEMWLKESESHEEDRFKILERKYEELDRKFTELKPLLREQNKLIRGIAKDYNKMDLPNVFEKILKTLDE